jgi:hypothetical protein
LGLLRIAWVPRAGAVLLVVPVVWASVALTVDVATHRRNYDRFEPVARELLGQLRAEGQPAGPVLVRFAGSPLGGLQGGIIDELDRNGAEVRVDPSGPHQFGYSRTARPEDVESVWYVAETGEVLDGLASQPGATVVAETHPLSPQDQAEYDAIQDRIRAALVTSGRDDLLPQLSSPYLAFVVEGIPGITKADLDRRSTLFDQQQRAVCHCGIVAFPPDQLPTS